MKKIRRLTDEQWAKLSPHVDDEGNFDVPRPIVEELPFSLLDVYEDILRRVNARLCIELKAMTIEHDRRVERVKELETRIDGACGMLRGRMSWEADAEAPR